MKNLMNLLFVLLVAGCMQAPQADLEGLKAGEEAWQSAYDANDPAALAAIYTEDATLLPPNGEMASGRAAIEAFWAAFQANGIGVKITDTEVYAHSDLGYTVGTFVATDAGDATIGEGKYLVVWRTVDGQWQMHRDVWNFNHPLPAPEPEM